MTRRPRCCIARSPSSSAPAARILPLLWLAAACMPAAGADGPPGRPDPKIEVTAALKAAVKAAQRGPVTVALAGQARMQVPPDFEFIPPAEAGRLMKAFGNTIDSGFQGMVVPRTDDDSFSFYDVTYHDAGYVKDDDAKNWNADKLLDQVRDGTAEANKRRVEMGVPELEVVGWIEKPNYDAGSHHLVWSIAARDEGSPAGDADGVNYRTLVLGREGYMSMTLVTDKAHIAALGPRTATLLDALKFDPGKRYADFNSGTDHVAEFGLAALVAGVAAKKLGLIALAAAFALKFAKIIGVAVVGGAMALRKWLGLRKNEPAAVPAPPGPISGPAP